MPSQSDKGAKGTGSDQRFARRSDMLLKVEYDDPRGLLADYLTNLSEGGLFIRTEQPFAVGDEVSFSLSFPGLMAPLRLHGQVRWRRDVAKRGHIKGVGVELEFDNDEQRERLEFLLANLRQAPGVKPLGDGTPLTVLLAEDSQKKSGLFAFALRRFREEFLDREAVNIITVHDGAQAWDTLNEQQVDVAIIDHFLPSLTGSDLIKRMRQDPRFQKTPILMVSAGGEDIKRLALDSGADLYVDKPELRAQMLRTIFALLFNRRMHGGDTST
jgi:uncharacterized protein (TIGR02266 family)